MSGRQPGPEDRSHACAGCTTTVEDADLCDDCRERYGAIAGVETEELTAEDAAWFDRVCDVLCAVRRVA